MKLIIPLFTILSFAPTSAVSDADEPQPSAASPSFQAKLQSTLVEHLNSLLDKDGSVQSLKGKTADGGNAIAFYIMFETTGDGRRYRQRLRRRSRPRSRHEAEV